MPKLKITGIEIQKVCDISTALIDELQKIIQCPREYFTIECITTTSILDGKIVSESPFIEIAWFDRGQEIQDTVAKITTNFVQQLGYPSIDIVFTMLEKNCYYENGEHF